MDVNEFLEGKSLTGRQAAMIFFGFLVFIVLSATLLVIFSDFFRGLVISLSPSGGTDVAFVGALASKWAGGRWPKWSVRRSRRRRSTRSKFAEP